MGELQGLWWFGHDKGMSESLGDRFTCGGGLIGRGRPRNSWVGKLKYAFKPRVM